MAIQFVRIEIIGRKDGGNACLKSAYNSRTNVRDENTGISYDFSERGGNVHHEIILPEHVDRKFEKASALSNEVERTEHKSNSQLFKEVVIALPNDKEIVLEDRIEITHRIINELGWVQNGLAVQVDIHESHEGDNNPHVHLLLTTRRFNNDGTSLGEKARDLEPSFRSDHGKCSIIPEIKCFMRRCEIQLMIILKN